MEAYLKAGEDALEPRELFDPLTLKGGALERSGLGPVELLPDVAFLVSFLSRAAGPDHSLSVAGVLMESSRSSTLLPLPPPLVEADPEIRLWVDELPLMSFSSFSWKSMKMRDRASL